MDTVAPETLHQTLHQALHPRRVALRVRDPGPVAAFYQDVIGLRPVAPGAGHPSFGVGTDALIELWPDPAAAPGDPAGAGLFHTAILLPSRADLGRWLAHAAALGIPLDGSADHLVSEAVYLHDPEGNGVEIYADRPRHAWTWNDGRIRMANRRLDLPGLLAAGAGAGWDGAPPGTRVGHVHLRVGDVAAATRFYAGVLGLDITSAGPQAVFLSANGYHHHLAVNTWGSLNADRREPGRAGLAEVVLAGADLPAIAHRAGRDTASLLDDGLADPWGTVLRFQP